MYTKLKIMSIGNQDWNGTWLKDDVEKEMKELECPPDCDTVWIKWTLDHVIGCWNDEYTAEMENIIVNPHVTKICFRFSDGDVTIVKC